MQHQSEARVRKGIASCFKKLEKLGGGLLGGGGVGMYKGYRMACVWDGDALAAETEKEGRGFWIG